MDGIFHEVKVFTHNPALEVLYGKDGKPELFAISRHQTYSEFDKYAGKFVYRWKIAAPSVCCVEKLFAHIEKSIDFARVKDKNGNIDKKQTNTANIAIRKFLSDRQVKFTYQGEEYVNPEVLRYVYCTDEKVVTADALLRMDSALELLKSRVSELKKRSPQVDVFAPIGSLKQKSGKELFESILGCPSAQERVSVKQSPLSLDPTPRAEKKNVDSDDTYPLLNDDIRASFISLHEAARILGVGSYTLEKWKKRGGALSIYKNPINGYKYCKRDDIIAIKGKIIVKT